MVGQGQKSSIYLEEAPLLMLLVVVSGGGRFGGDCTIRRLLLY